MASIGVGSTTHSSVELFLYSLDTSWADGIRTVYWYLGSANGGIPTDTHYSHRAVKTLDEGVSEGGYATITGLEANSSYGVYCEVWSNHKGFLVSLEGYVRTDKAPDWNLATSAWGNMDIKYTNNIYEDLSHLFRYYYALMYRAEVTFDEDCHVEIYSEGSLDVCGYFGTSSAFDDENGVPYSYDMYDDNSGGSGNFKISCDISAGTYYVWVRSCDPDELGYTSLTIECSKISDGVDISRWSWEVSNGTASDGETSDAYNAVYYEQPTTNFSHKVWNDMVSKVYDVAFAKTKWWDSDYASVDDTKFTSEPYELTAVMFNSLRNNIELIGNRSDVLGYKTGIGRVFPGDEVDGDYFLTLANYMNDCIDVINSS